MTHRPFRFGLGIGANLSRDAFVPLVRRAEAMGFSTVFGPDHVGAHSSAVLPMLTVAAEVAPSIRVSPMVIANDYRHPVMLAKDAATIDLLSEGRFELGIGTGWIEAQYRESGLPYDSPGTRVGRLEEAIAVIKGCWSGEPFTFAGDHYRVDAVTCPRPHQKPHPPVLIAGTGPRMLRLAGREADIAGISPLTLGVTDFSRFGEGIATSGERIAVQIGWVRDGAGDRFDEVELSVIANHVVVTDDVSDAIDELAAETGAASSEIAASPHILIGPVEHIVDTLVERRERYGLSYIGFGVRNLEEMEPVVDRLAGT